MLSILINSSRQLGRGILRVLLKDNWDLCAAENSLKNCHENGNSVSVFLSATEKALLQRKEVQRFRQFQHIHFTNRIYILPNLKSKATISLEIL